MKREDHEELLNELLKGDLEHSRKTEILQTIREDYGSTLAEKSEIEKMNERLAKDNDDLIVSNSKLFRQAGIVTEDKKKEEVEKSISETITLESLNA